ncbi:MAG: acyl-CoA dehydrogenase family protein [Dehalococcoidia bacterium]
MSVDSLPSELEALRSRLHAFLNDELLPAERGAGLEDEAAASDALRRWVRTRSNELGFFRLAQSADVGGGGLGPLGQTALREAIAASGSLLGRFVLGGGGGLLRHGTAEQQAKYLDPVLSGEVAAAFAFTDARQGPRTTAVRAGDGFRVTGLKSFVTGGPHADLLLTVATVTENGDGPTGSAIFIIPRIAPGVTLRRELHTLDGGVHGEFTLQDVAVPPEDLLGEIGKGLPRALENITGLRLGVAASACGTGLWTLEYTLSQVDQPHRTGTPLAEREQVQAMIADSATELYAARAALYAAARAAEAGEAVDVEAAMAKSIATETVARIVDRAIQLTGGAAVVEGHPLARLYRQIRGWRIAEGTTEILRLSIARGLLELRHANA